MIVWPFQTLSVLLESEQWLTDVLRSKDSEQRFAMRRNPLRSFRFSHVFDHSQYNAAKSLIRQNDSFLIPDWKNAVNVGSLSIDSAPFVNYGNPYAGLTDGDKVLVWESDSKYESATIVSMDSADGLYLSGISDDYDKAKVIPLMTATAQNGLESDRPAGGHVSAQIEFEVLSTSDIGQSAYSQYRGHDVISDCPVVSSGSFSEPIAWPTESFSDDIGYKVYIDRRNTFDNMTMMRWHVFSDSDLYSLRRFLHSRRGKWKSFWLSSYADDFVLAQAVGASDTSIIVYAPKGISDLGVTTFDLEIDSTYNRQVTSYVESTPVNGIPTLQLNISSQIGDDVGLGARISYLNFMRFNSDRVEYSHQAKGGTAVAMQCIELNEL